MNPLMNVVDVIACVRFAIILVWLHLCWKENDRCCDIIILDIWLFTRILRLKSTHNPTANTSRGLSGSTVSSSQHTLDKHCKIQHKPAHMLVGDGCAQ